MPLTSIQELTALSKDAKEFLNKQAVGFLDMRHIQKVNEKFNHASASEMLMPAETFELEVKHKMSNAAHEILQAVNRINDCKKQNSELDTVDYLRYARTNLEEAGKDLDAAKSAFKALEIYFSRIERASDILGKELEATIAEIFDELEQMKNFQKSLFEKTIMLINDIRGEGSE
jgi:vacuolar-type H+-ATPase subunit I/STV1